MFARRLQLQEQLTGQIADALMNELKAKGAAVVIEAEHMYDDERNKKTGQQDGDICKKRAV